MAAMPRLSLQAPALLARGERVISTDERTGMPALERLQPAMPMGPGRVERRECAYSRRGTVTLIANFDVAQGHVIAPSMGPTRTAEDCVTHRRRTVASEPAVPRWHFVTDTLNLHQSESLVRFVAQYDGITADLGHKATCGMLKSMAPRAAFFSAPTQRIVCHSTPKYASWLNQIDMWFSILVWKLLKRASCSSVADLQTPVLAFITYCNATMAKPFTWTYGRQPLSV
jgi:DDE superfamily endonuclease